MGDFVETAVIDSEAERTVLLDKKDGWASGRLRRTDELIVEVLVEELPKRQLLDFGEGIYRTVRKSSVIHKVDMVVMGASRRKGRTHS